jgi:hypothetical protein
LVSTSIQQNIGCKTSSKKPGTIDVAGPDNLRIEDNPALLLFARLQTAVMLSLEHDVSGRRHPANDGGNECTTWFCVSDPFSLKPNLNSLME